MTTPLLVHHMREDILDTVLFLLRVCSPIRKTADLLLDSSANLFSGGHLRGCLIVYSIWKARPTQKEVAYLAAAANVSRPLPNRLIHTAASFASFFTFRGLSTNESTFCRMVWK